MILADKILNLRKKNGWSQEELAELLGVSRQAISKWEGAQSIPDISKIIEMASLFGVSTDFLLKDEIEIPELTGRDTTDRARRLSVAEAGEYMKIKKAQGRRIALGTLLCILSPITLILLAGVSGVWSETLAGEVAVAVGLVVLFGAVAVAVSLFIMSGGMLGKLEFIEKKEFVLEYGLEGILRERLTGFERRYLFSNVVGVMMCILGVLPLILAGILDTEEASPFIILIAVALLLAIVAVAVYIFISVGTMKSAYDRLLGQGEFDPDYIKRSKMGERIAGVYWPLVTAIYLLWSFLSGGWHISWVIWPIAALLFAGLAAAFGFDERD